MTRCDVSGVYVAVSCNAIADNCGSSPRSHRSCETPYFFSSGLLIVSFEELQTDDVFLQEVRPVLDAQGSCH